MSEFLVWRQVICPFDRDRRILQYLVTTPVFSEDGRYSFLSVFLINLTAVMCRVAVAAGTIKLWFYVAAELHLASYESEGPENNMEKDSRRSLRWAHTFLKEQFT